MKIISFSNQKGGFGKTTSAINLSACLAELGCRILLIDLDPQANASSSLGINQNLEHSIYPVLHGKKKITQQIVPSQIKNLSLIPSDLELAGIEIELARQKDHLKRLSNIIHPLKKNSNFDYCFFDTPPSLGILMTSALACADEIIIPLQCEYFGLEGLSKIVHVLDQIKKSGVNSNVKVEGILMTLYDKRTNLAKQVVEDVRTHFGEIVYQTIIPRTIRLGEAPSFCKTIIEYENHGSGSNAYRQFAKEFIERHS